MVIVLGIRRDYLKESFRVTATGENRTGVIWDNNKDCRCVSLRVLYEVRREERVVPIRIVYLNHRFIKLHQMNEK